MLLVRTRLGPSRIHGVGLFADEPIASGTVVWEFAPGFDLLVAPHALRALSEPAREQFRRYSYLDSKLGMYVLCFDDARFMNHSESPNLDDRSVVRDGMGVTIAIGDIPAGAELTCDYSAFDAEWGSYSLSGDGKDPALRHPEGSGSVMAERADRSDLDDDFQPSM